ncbi:hypothetical protein GPAL_3655 [Glaciecola pallidula DSM 14239 = ACAM 615]|uniref:Uncharacterized protein n=1 Tax=Brumicola pallidula DSM 14239 = ACAM 615 TaxID=1121922 RepID=K6Z2P6_9ALTE|nr:hypothetical protein GPAL_3655 [Glaciecola pallidula DSM 14239 = ACAM 615]
MRLPSMRQDFVLPSANSNSLYHCLFVVIIHVFHKVYL